MKKPSLRPNKPLAKILAGKRDVRVTNVAGLSDLAEALSSEGMEELLFPGTEARKKAAAEYFASTPVANIVAAFKLPTYFPETMSRWALSGNEELQRKRIVWLIEYMQGGRPVANEHLTEAHEGHAAGSSIWDLCPYQE